MAKKVMIGMSGGVDSSVAAAILLEQGYEVIGATLKLRQNNLYTDIQGGCCSIDDVDQIHPKEAPCQTTENTTTSS